MRSLYLPALCLFLFAAPAVAAKPVLWLCKPDLNTDRTAVPPEVAILHDEEKGTALVNDGWVMKYKGEPIPAKVRIQDGKTTFSWKITGIRSRNARTGTLQFWITIERSTGRMTAQVRPLGYDNDYKAQGLCKPAR